MPNFAVGIAGEPHLDVLENERTLRAKIGLESRHFGRADFEREFSRVVGKPWCEIDRKNFDENVMTILWGAFQANEGVKRLVNKCGRKEGRRIPSPWKRTPFESQVGLLERQYMRSQLCRVLCFST